MSLYIDTSCLWKLMVAEPGSVETRELIETEPRVVISTLAELEVALLLRALLLGGSLRRRQHEALVEKLVEFRGLPPFVHHTTPVDLARVARDQTRRTAAHCRTLDRLHLAAMETLGVQRLLTNDDSQAAAARELGFGVVLPR